NRDSRPHGLVDAPIDADPRIEITADSAAMNLVLIGKESLSFTSNRGVETHVDVVHGPLDANIETTSLESGRWLPPGRWYVSIEAGTDAPVGQYGSGAVPDAHPASDMNQVNDTSAWTTSFRRGAGNEEG